MKFPDYRKEVLGAVFLVALVVLTAGNFPTGSSYQASVAGSQIENYYQRYSESHTQGECDEATRKLEEAQATFQQNASGSNRLALWQARQNQNVMCRNVI